MTETDRSMLTPREIVSELDKYIVGQNDAKRAVAVALRNRWRRSRVPEPLHSEITPKNILIRAVKGNVGKEKKKRVLREIRSLTEEFGFSPTLLRLLEQDGILSSEEKEGRESLECS